MRFDSDLLWSKSAKGHWHRLGDLDLGQLDDHGVYVVWHGGYPSRVVRVGSGDLGEELRAVRDHPDTPLYTQTGPLYVTWAVVDSSSAPGVCRYLADKLRPLVEDASGVAPIAVNSPF